MTAEIPVRDGVLSIDQWQLLDRLAATISAQQARWISGYFAGLDHGLSRIGGITLTAPQAPPARSLTILTGSETGNSRALAAALLDEAAGRGLNARKLDLADYKQRELKDEDDLLFVVSTHGEGDPPASALGFFEWIEGPRAPRLEGKRFAVLALGDSTYEKFCEAGRRIDARLEALGADRLADRIDCDVDYDEPAASWRTTVLDLLATDAPSTVPASVATPLRVVAPVHDRRNPFTATVVENIPIVGRHSTKESRHVELDLGGSGLAYQPGDALGILPTNNPHAVEALLAATGLSANDEVAVKDTTLTLGDALAHRLEIVAATPRFLDQWSELSDASELRALKTALADRAAFLRDHHVVDIVERFPVPGIDAASLVASLRPLQPRLYSLASSQAFVGDEAHLLVAPVRYELYGSPRGGVASTQIADRLPLGETVPVYIQENPNFRLPADDVPVVMVGPGTGVAPFRAFLQEREVREAKGRNWLFFGERNFRSDFLYQLELQKWLADRLLSQLDVAFSRDGEKTYVQHRMAERSRDLYSWLEEGAHLYVCGDSAAMAPDVNEALIAIVEREGGKGREAAEDYVRTLAADRRYQRDVY
ncbi:assimilatory sulfite reductase (NADPH) flavoprotein subunit [Sphingomonas jaspsi]|uniref:assimilatory sulfite reductase (NADPH) flavoprotein subunit n=1 Tax=Sphingomonas jaspsi TaxID=392409 RepID=UPI0004B5F354|nr:assimilatory sulfite reductase (NADPH) flavoprotein subunit [Sphingomonas jaspsi]